MVNVNATLTRLTAILVGRGLSCSNAGEIGASDSAIAISGGWY